MIQNFSTKPAHSQTQRSLGLTIKPTTYKSPRSELADPVAREKKHKVAAPT